ncbi:MAG: 4-(cytidine 5'-diphospho)-2-C-methyl-D-erythritol kinase [Armatimonadota bacterium]
MPEITVLCHAKINLSLEILGRRDDGFHNLSTIFQAVTLHDELQVRLEPAPGVPVDELRVAGLTVPVEGNLVLRAVEAYRREIGLDGQTNIGLHKHIPSGAGLGGGSSDAAGTLFALASLAGPAGASGVPELAAELGSDVAFFLGSGTALGQGRGDVLEPLPTPVGFLVLAKPEESVNTAEAYRLLQSVDFTDGIRTQACSEKIRAGYGLHEVASDLYNGFAAPVERRWPTIRVLRERLLSLGAQCALMTGSGAAVFGIFVDRPASDAAAAQLTEEGYWAAAVSPAAQGLMVAQ